ncbi:MULTISPECIES: peptide chain release factor N(5)-glutamine methyltransferase [Clostridium]|mgnify:CR=1 FL=1|jgi:protein-(glutamine-N5) methyltransferase, release factor-specific|uniref:Release factor glutamine methyltransferase n=2 Tax=Clostridium beijerinckii TaxID=1520 RepID=A0A7Y9D7L7_CLOBE|nr:MULTISPECIES: peptide chain release factor N(5)-glutamine methyltransferase [Clostridium]ABR32591.1 modification methylase, HemK family [Clostridium beijerinckii NCIMB 8052]AIU04424.1 HemK family modification methylase [Clostridium beijerinckii ATCC 35702]AQS03037.1 release factor glutamine methyltransferase [Clostridium beijerinckii]MBA2888159.1 release factor-specific protein-(glutamine-N5) methyltransferase [Clostridium beijerinckii]MBA2902891.1 release factor-specific protein-(glutamine
MERRDVGGQAVIEGVMMRGSKNLATAVRTPKGNIEIDFKDNRPVTKKYPILNIPFLRGFFVLVESMKVGMESLNYSASFLEEDNEEPSKFEKWLDDKLGEKANSVLMAITMFISFLFAIGLFVALPTGIASVFKGAGISNVMLNLVEALIRIVILLLYMFSISKLNDIYRVFQYHGAEHKTIFCYEAMEELTVENVRKQSRLHPRCGTNFLFLVMFVSIIVFSFTGWGGIIERLALRIILIPVVTGISYEIIKWLGKNDSMLAQIIAYPGLKLQLLTTKEPDDSQIEVAIASLKAAEGIKDPNKNIEELIKTGTFTLKENGIDTARLDAELLLGNIIEKDRVYLITHKEDEVSKEDAEKYFDLIEKRRNKMPVKYILNKCEFMGIEFYVEEGVLIPRGDTEILVDEVLKIIEENQEMQICDLCSGSGAVGISLAHFRQNIKVDLIDYYPIPEKVSLINIEKNKLEDRVFFIKSDLLEESIKNNKIYDIIVSNPPYIEECEIGKLMEDVKNYEPHTALNGGNDGLDFYRKIIDQSQYTLRESGILAFEIGYNQGEAVKLLMENNGFTNVKIVKDFASLDRVVVGIKI